MDADSWLWVALIAFLVFCCVPMFFMGRRNKHSHPGGRSDGRGHGPSQS
jgi:hypothetical protein